ncbi:hypothetical protein [Brevibacillus sp. SAFN-007a]|uniref:hypothetical protein n=1 Tax=Brevibacillus sp. SAFN-007a TaxID=3436862 RepID=UPI003F81EA07
MNMKDLEPFIKYYLSSLNGKTLEEQKQQVEKDNALINKLLKIDNDQEDCDDQEEREKIITDIFAVLNISGNAQKENEFRSLITLFTNEQLKALLKTTKEIKNLKEAK